MSQDAISPALAIAIAAVGIAALAIVEWRRRDRRNRIARIAASVAAVAALCGLGIYRIGANLEPRAVVDEAVLWTHNAAASGSHSTNAATHFALPGMVEKPANAVAVPDVAYIRREFPEIRRLRVVGDGLEPWQIEALRDVELIFDDAERKASTPAISFLNFPRDLAIGEPLRLQGSIEGLAAGKSMTLTVVSPDGTKTEATVNGADAPRTTFQVIAPAPRSAGQFVWQVNARSAGDGDELLNEQIGIAAVRPYLPRVLVLESSPSLETAHLQRWFGDLGGVLTSRTAVAQGRYRIATTADTAPEFGAIDRGLLAQHDVLLIDAEALHALATDERAAIEAAVMEEGLGVLAFVAGAEPAHLQGQPLLPWQLESEAVEESGPRTARVWWRGLATPLEHPIAVESLRMQLTPKQTSLVTDMQQRALVGAARHGRGQVAVSIVRDTWKWRLQDQPGEFASFWSHLLTRLAKPRDRQAERWAIENADSVPLAVNRPVELRLSGPEKPPVDAHVTSDGGDERVPLALAEDAVDPHHWRSTFWPQRAGWHRVQLGPAGAHLDFFVHEADAWASLAPERRNTATRLAAARSSQPPHAKAQRDEQVQSGAASTVLLYVLFLCSTGYLWVERRRASA